MRFPNELPDRRTNPPEHPEVTRRQVLDHQYGYCRPNCPLCAEERERAEEER